MGALRFSRFVPAHWPLAFVISMVRRTYSRRLMLGTTESEHCDNLKIKARFYSSRDLSRLSPPPSSSSFSSVFVDRCWQLERRTRK